VNLQRAVKRAVLTGLRRSGGFAACRALTRRGLRILCYHGISLADEHVFNGQLFMRPALFRARMRRLVDSGFTVLPLGPAIEALREGRLPDRAVVLTFDDGWYGIYRHALPVLAELRLPATLYVTTYYVERRTPVFNVAVHYLFWAARVAYLDVSLLSVGLTGRYDLSDPAQRRAAAQAVEAHGDERLSSSERQTLLLALARHLGVDPALLGEQRVCGLMSPDEVAAAAAAGVDIQLHTHRHTLPSGQHAAFIREIADNRASLGRMTPAPLIHLCYPSGVYHPRSWPWLEELGIETATTTRPGLNYRDGKRFELFRFLDGEHIGEIEFDAEMAGALEISRRLRGTVKRIPGRPPDRT